jgi:hypothetical protein
VSRGTQKAELLGLILFNFKLFRFIFMPRENQALAEEDKRAEEAKRPFAGKGNVLAAPSPPRYFFIFLTFKCTDKKGNSECSRCKVIYD